MISIRLSAALTLGAILISAISAADSPKSKPKGKPNRLAGEVSPYLLQHAHNPVDWHPWGPEAFAKAKKEGKIVFLSIGYSSCHWCHVMERESFSSPVVAELMNRHFICIKVDREERPDVDEVYMTSLQVVGENGGWPLSMFLTDDGKPIFGGTYWPPEDRRIEGETVPGFKSVLKRVVELQETDRAGLLKQAERVAELTSDALERTARAVPILKLDRDLVKDAAEAFAIDPEHGGFGSPARGFRGTKFPRASALTFLYREARQQKNDSLTKLVTLTLDKMAAGGIYDHLGGGFHRYSTERTWTVPHFEKMLYDNAQLVELYAEAYRVDPKPEYRRVIEDSLAFVAREMTSPEGVFYSALDADSNEKEGEFYVWSTKELDELLGAGEPARLFKSAYGLDHVNFEEKYHILRLPRPLAETAKSHMLGEAELITRLAPLKQKLLTVREKRERPFLDTKVLTGWNGQMIAAYARAGEALKEKKYIEAAEKAATVLLEKMRTKDGRLLRIYAAQPGQKPQARRAAFLEDYAFLLHGLLALHDATGNARWLEEAKAVAEPMLKWHGDADRGGFYMIASDGEKLFARGKDYYDGAQPSGNGSAAGNLLMLWLKTKDDRYKVAVEKTVKLFAGIVRTQPTAAPLTAGALGRLLELAKPDK